MIVNFLLEKISVEKKKDVTGNVEVKNKTKITDLKEQTIDALGNKQNTLNVYFSFSITYEPNIASILIEGKIIDVMDEKDKKAVLESWKKDSKIDPKYSSPWMNAILSRCNVKALSLGNDINLPPHIPFPRLAKKGQIEKKK
ncbi:hypothetical protein J4208_05480 [Candidatus Woesearchaeota archaeon]|nr:hypothetical protein [Candidatus Woesearchaeota archaeon]